MFSTMYQPVEGSSSPVLPLPRACKDGAAEGEAAPAIDVEAEVQAAMDAVPKPEPAPITEEDLLNSLLESGKVSKDQIVQSLALYHMGIKAYSVDPLFADEVQPVAPT